MAKILISLGIILVVVGVLWLIFPSLFSWIGNLPGDIKHSSGTTKIYFPVVTMLMISVVATIIINIFNR